MITYYLLFYYKAFFIAVYILKGILGDIRKICRQMDILINILWDKLYHANYKNHNILLIV